MDIIEFTSLLVKHKSQNMKFLSVVLGVAFLVHGGWGQGCTISKEVSGTSSVVIQLLPVPADALAAAGLSDSKSPLAILNLLDTFGGAAQGVINKMISLTSVLFPFAKAPSCRYYSVSNQMFCDNVNSAILQPLCSFFGIVKAVSKPITFPMPQSQYVPLSCENDTTLPWGVKTVHGPECWNAGFNGQGIVVANIDSGVLATHQELKDNFRPKYNWYNAYNPKNTTPYDSNGHGTHTMGSMVGKTVGVAPGATWLACMGCNDASCDNEQLIACGQFLSCPDRKEQNCTTIPDIINNSWGGGIGNTMFQGVLAVWKAMGIKSFFATGNSGPMCSTVASPADGNWTQWGIMSVGATACNEAIASYSSTGPSQAADYMLGLGVSIVGPGSNVRSSWGTNNTAYNTLSGTSMSSPTVAGVAAVLLSKNKQMNAQQLYDVMMNYAYQNPDVHSPLCGGSSLLQTTPFPNNVYGSGRVDCAASLAHVTAL